MRIECYKAFIGKEWKDSVALEIDSNGILESVVPLDTVEGRDILVPGLVNAHSHAFQYAMAGLAENRGSKSNDSFWSWRESMYRLALRIRPEEMELIARVLYRKMLSVGYTAVVEFHYLHQDEKGKPYSNTAEMSEALIRAAKTTGIRLCLVPVLYQRGGFGKALDVSQRRFDIPKIDQYWQLVETCKKSESSTLRVGVGVHSIRAAEMEAIRDVMSSSFPVKHIHIAEQPREIEDCLQFYKKRPVQWFADEFGLDDTMNLVHATHLDPSEVQILGSSDARVIVCPSTEANLGDGIFPLREFVWAGGKWAVGSDSHITVDPFTELRCAEYHQRLITHQRNLLCSEIDDDSGEALFTSAVAGGSLASGFEGFLQIGKPFHGVVLDGNNPLLYRNFNLLSTIVFSSDPTWVKRVVVGSAVRFEKDGQLNSPEDLAAFGACLSS